MILRETRTDRSMENQGTKGLLFLTTILSKMSQMFSELNFIYVNSMMNQTNVEITEEYTTNSLIQEEKHKMEQAKMEKQQKDTNNGNIGNKEKGDELEVPWLDEYDIDKQQESNTAKNGGSNTGEQKMLSENKKLQKSIQNPVQEQNLAKQQRETSYITPPHPPPSSFILFLRDNRQKIAQAYPGISRGELSKIASNCWKSLTAEQKSIYHEEFNIQKQKYHEQMKQYNRQREIIEGIRQGKQNGKTKPNKAKQVKVSKKKDKKTKPIISEAAEAKPTDNKIPQLDSDSDSI